MKYVAVDKGKMSCTTDQLAYETAANLSIVLLLLIFSEREYAMELNEALFNLLRIFWSFIWNDK
jgi:hypothetical protein